MADIADLVNEPKEKGRFLNLILTRHVDFVVCDMRHRTAVLGIELDDSSHKKYDRTQSDEFKNTVFKQAEFPLLRFDVRTYKTADIETKIREALGDENIYRAPTVPGRQG
jgi:hypothetical protein